MQRVRQFFEEIDRLWDLPRARKVELRVIGSAALMLQTDYTRGTKDSDILETSDLTADITTRLLELAGKGTEIHARHNVYIDIVGSAVPFLPQVPIYHTPVALNEGLRHFEVRALDVVDVAVSKLKRFNANDSSDIQAMIRAGRLEHEMLITRFRAAVDAFSCDARAEDLPSYVARLHRVERDMFGVGETEIELPSWVE